MTEKKEMSEPVESARISLLMSRVGVGRMDRPVVRPALELAEATGEPAAAIELLAHADTSQVLPGNGLLNGKEPLQ